MVQWTVCDHRYRGTQSIPGSALRPGQQVPPGPCRYRAVDSQNPDSAKSIINGEIKRITGKGMLTNELDIAFNNLTITYDPLTTTLTQSADRAYSLGFLGSSKPDLSGIYNLGLLNQVLASKGLATVQGP